MLEPQKTKHIKEYPVTIETIFPLDTFDVRWTEGPATQRVKIRQVETGIYLMCDNDVRPLEVTIPWERFFNKIEELVLSSKPI